MSLSPCLVRCALRSAYSILALVLFHSVALAQIETEDGAVTSPEIPTLREYFRYLEADNLRDLRLDNQFALGLTPKFELRLTVPIHFREVRFRGATAGRERAELYGLGDTSLRAKYSLFQTDDVMESTRWAALGEFTAPTGEHDKKEGGVEIPRRLQLGTGTWGFGAGTVFTMVRDRHRTSADFYYRYRTRHDGFQPGQSLDLNLAYWFRLHPVEFEPAKKQIEIRPVIELLSSYRFDSQGRSGRLGDEGLQMWLAPGLQLYASPSVQFEFNVKAPLIDTIDDEIGDRKWGGGFAIKIRF